MSSLKWAIGSLAAGVWLSYAAVLQAQTGDAEERTIFSGVFTEEQAARGKQLYGNSCGGCHGPTGRGGVDAPGIIAYVLDQKYEDAPLISYYSYMSLAMPLGRPGSLPAQAYVDITAFLLSAHGAPAGSEELTTDEDLLSSIIIVRKPK